MKRRPPEISIVVPAFNEGQRIKSFLSGVLAVHKTEGGIAEVIVVDDGSDDNTVEEVMRFEDVLPLRVIKMGENKGKWAALREGMLVAKEPHIAFMDADGSVSPFELLKCLGIGPGIAVFGTRFGRDAYVDGKSLKRTIISNVYRWYVYAWYKLCGGREFISDMQCPLKVFWRQDILDVWVEDRFCGDVEFALSLRASIVNLPVRFVHKRGGSVRASTAWKMLVGTPRAAWRRRGGP